MALFPYDRCESHFTTAINALSHSGCRGGLAQWLEQGAHNALVVGSNPSPPTTLHPEPFGPLEPFLNFTERLRVKAIDALLAAHFAAQ